jgi:hypothetical protein
MVRPCRSSADTHNPDFKMHNCAEGAETTTCGLPVLDVNRVHEYKSLCPVCWPQEPPAMEEPWTETTGTAGDKIAGR